MLLTGSIFCFKYKKTHLMNRKGDPVKITNFLKSEYVVFLCSSSPQRYIMLSLWEPLAIYRLVYKTLFYAAPELNEEPFFCIPNNLTLSLSPPHKIIPYLIQIWNFVKYIFLKLINLSHLSVTGSYRISCLILNIKTACGYSILDYLRY